MSKDSSISSSDDDSVVFLGDVTPQGNRNRNRYRRVRRRMLEGDNGIPANPNPNDNRSLIVGGHDLRARRTVTGNNQPNRDGNASEESTTATKKAAGQVRKSGDANFQVGESSKIQKRKTKKRGRKKKKKENDDVLDEMRNKLLRAGWEIGIDEKDEETVFYDLKGRAYTNCIIAAYECLKKKYEEHKGRGIYYLKNFKFTPIKDDDFEKLLSWKDAKKRKRKDEAHDPNPNNNDRNKRGKNSREDANKKKQKQRVETSRKGKEKVVYDESDSDSDSDSDKDPNDNTCLLCANAREGTLVCCDGCPSSFHLSCLKLPGVPPGDWYCSYCRCKFCGLMTGAADDPMSRTCCFCEHKYHRFCSPMTGGIIIDLSDNPLHFCSNKCEQLFARVQGLLGIKHEIGDGFSCTFLSGFENNRPSQLPECHDKLFSALKIMQDGFKPGYDHRTGVNLIQNVVYSRGSKFNRMNHTMFFTAIMERDDEIICVASLRVHENKVAEMPLITTRGMYRRQGMCTRFMTVIESVLSSLGVDLLVIPSIKEREKIWVSVFGFEPFDLETKTRTEKMKILVCPDSVMLKKNINRVV
ncbi:hypothetical protein HN51_038794 [Arachis hypogaea]|nr:increased DNA methylation 1 [Arachis hypogaea]XP_029149402.1 increased DNA methylation 1 [Arachis hypogaea]QHN84218.1 Increased DNA methylation [Arachis hypogaea]